MEMFALQDPNKLSRIGGPRLNKFGRGLHGLAHMKDNEANDKNKHFLYRCTPLSSTHMSNMPRTFL